MGSLSCYLLALRGRAGMFSIGNPLALSLKRALGKPIGNDLMIHKVRCESNMNSKLVPPKNNEVIRELLVKWCGLDGESDPAPYQHCFTLPHVAGSVGDNQCWESQV